MREFLNDLLSTIFFFIVYSLFGDIFIATGVAIAVGVVQIAYMRWRERPIDAMQWLSLALVVVLGGATLATQNPHFVMIKPSAVHFAIAAVMLRRGWLSRYLPPIARENLSEAAIVGWGYGWAALMIALGITNLVVAFNFDPRTWAWFITFGAVGAKLVLAAIQYVTLRAMVVRRIRLQRAAAMT
jgi:intracellular septation protein A